jgi:hypothetical protein
MMEDLHAMRGENKRLKSELHFATTQISTLMRQVSRESKALESKCKSMFKSGLGASICQPQQAVQRKTFRSGTSVSIEHFV